LIAVISLLLG